MLKHDIQGNLISHVFFWPDQKKAEIQVNLREMQQSDDKDSDLKIFSICIIFDDVEKFELSREKYEFGGSEIIDSAHIDEHSAKIVFLTENTAETIAVTAENISYSVTKHLIYDPQGEDYGFELFAARFGGVWGKPDDCLFIYFSDFEYIIDSVRSVYPLTDPDTKEIIESFDVCGMNWIHTEAWDRIIENLHSIPRSEKKLEKFISDFCSWIAEHQKNSDEIMVYGTL